MSESSEVVGDRAREQKSLVRAESLDCAQCKGSEPAERKAGKVSCGTAVL